MPGARALPHPTVHVVVPHDRGAQGDEYSKQPCLMVQDMCWAGVHAVAAGGRLAHAPALLSPG